jgi:hypothetical protein
LRHGDGRFGCVEGAPFDRILVTAAALDLEPAWLAQLRADGLLQVPLDLAPGLAYLVLGTQHAGVFEGRLLRPAYFMPLRAENEETRDDSPLSVTPLPPPEKLPSVSAPWAEWSDRKASYAGPGLLPSLAFLGWLHGYSISYQARADGRMAYGIGDPLQGHACWLGQRQWRVTGKAGRDLGQRLWRTFLDCGGPWPTEFRLRATPLDMPTLVDREAKDTQIFFHRRGLTCHHLWTLAASRARPA